ncbi:MAG: hypothetical protein JXO22_01885 [Phycisphaerae bacterium]|nr:hypothetical protein [Phycisphaerae bacterium]
MHWGEFFLQTSKDTPKDAANAAHRLLIRAGFLRQHGPGVYSHLPAAQRVVARLRRIIGEELRRDGLLEWSPASVTPAGLAAGRLDAEDGEAAGLSPTRCADALAADFAHAQIKSYKQLPVGVFAWQAMPNDGLAARRTLLRNRAPLVCEMQGFFADGESLAAGRERLTAALGRIMKRVGLACTRAADVSDDGAAGVTLMVETPVGGECIARTADGSYVAMFDAASAAEPAAPPNGPLDELVEVYTPDAGRVEDVCRVLGNTPRDLIKTLIYTAAADGDGPRPRIVALVRGDHEVNERKLCRVVGREVELADAELIGEITGARVGFAGPVGLVERVDRLIVDRDVTVMRNAATGANKSDHHITGVNPGRDFPLRHERVTVADIRNVVASDAAPNGGGELQLVSAARVGAVFELGTALCERLQATYLDRAGKTRALALLSGRLDMDQMMALVAEMHHDDDGLIWSPAVAPFDAVVLAIDPRDEEVMRVAQQVHDELIAAGVDALLDDRDDRAGSKFKDADLIGIPLRVVVGKRALAAGGVEFATRGSREKVAMGVGEAVERVRIGTKGRRDEGM